MRRIAVGSGLIASGMVRTADAMASVVGSVPMVVLSPTGMLRETDAEARVRVANLKARFSPRRVRIGDFSDDFDVLRRDALILGEDMKKAERILPDVK